MFDRYQISTAPSSISVDITERRAPTDESVKLLREMESAARSEVMKSMTLPSNDLRGVLHSREDHFSARTNVAVLINLNGKKMRVDVDLDDFADDTEQKRVDKLVAAVARTLTVEVLTPIFSKPDVRHAVASSRSCGGAR